MRSGVLLGAQGWDHPEWVGELYPPGATRAEWLAHYSASFPTVEVGDTFYGIPPQALVARWRDAVPATFVFSARVPQQVTHEGRFAEPGRFLWRFLDRVGGLGDRLGPLLVTVVSGFAPSDENRAVFRRFAGALPSEFRWAVEFRTANWLSDDVLDLFRRRNISVVIGTSRWIRRGVMLDLALAPTADFGYCRWSGPPSAGERPGAAARGGRMAGPWASAVRTLSRSVGTVFGYVRHPSAGRGLALLEDFAQRIAGREAS